MRSLPLLSRPCTSAEHLDLLLPSTCTHASTLCVRPARSAAGGLRRRLFYLRREFVLDCVMPLLGDVKRTRRFRILGYPAIFYRPGKIPWKIRRSSLTG